MMRLRPTVRLLVTDPRRRVLLFKFEDEVALDPAQPDLTAYWVTPGGGVEANETFEKAGLRELREETGIRTDALGPWVWSRDLTIHLPDESVRFRERYYLTPVAETSVALGDLLPYERRVYRAHRWWTIEEMRRSEEVFLPPGMPCLLEDVMEGNIPPEPLELDP